MPLKSFPFFIWPHRVETLNGLVREDFEFIEKKVLEVDPNAKIDWKSPIHEFLDKNHVPKTPFFEN